MKRCNLLGWALGLLLLAASPAFAASTTPPNLNAATTASSGDLMLIWPAAGPGPLSAITWTNIKAQIAADLAGTWLRPSQNLADVLNASTARTNLGLGSAALINTGTSAGTLCLLNTGCTWSTTQTFTVAPVFTDQSGSRTALGLGTAATQNTGTSGANVPLLNGTNTWSGVQTHSAEIVTAATATGGAGLNLPPGTAPTSPSNGDLWCTSASCFFRANGATQNMQGVASGTWTPTFTIQTPGNLSVSYVVQAGEYVKIGAFCQVWFNVDATLTFTTASGDLVVAGIPNAEVDSPSGVSGTAGGSIIPNIFGLGSAAIFTAPGISSTSMTFQYASSMAHVVATNLTSGGEIQVRGNYSYPC